MLNSGNLSSSLIVPRSSFVLRRAPEPHVFAQDLVVVDDRLFHALVLVMLDVLVELLDRFQHEGLGLLLAMLALGQFKEDPAPREQGVREPLLQRPEAVAAFLQGAAELHPVRLPLATHRFDVIHLDGDVLDALAVLLDELVDLRFDALVVALHERDLRVPALDNHGIHARELTAHVPCGPDHIESQYLREQVLGRSQIRDAQCDVIDPHRDFHRRSLPAKLASLKCSLRNRASSALNTLGPAYSRTYRVMSNKGAGLSSSIT